MIEKIQYTDFQRHESRRIELDKVTTFVGPSDSGKSSLIRGLQWLATNKPGGDAFIRNGAASTEVKALVDGKTIARRKGKGGNLYRLGKQEFKAFGANVPEPIADLLSIGPLNFQGQHDSVFWFSETSGEVAKRLNAIIDLEVIDRSAGFLAGQVRNAKSKKDVSEQRLKDAEAEAAELKWVPVAAAELEQVRKLATEATESRTKASRLASIRRSVADRLNDKRKADKAVESGVRACKAMGAFLGAETRSHALADMLTAIRRMEKQAIRPPDFGKVDLAWEAAETISGKRERLAGLVARIRRAEKDAIRPPDFDGVEAAFEESERAGKRRDELVGLLNLIRHEERRLSQQVGIWGDAVRELNEATEGLCPLCGGNLP